MFAVIFFLYNSSDFSFHSQNYIYWDDWSQEAILKANKYSGEQRETVLGNLSGIMDLKVFHNASQQGRNLVSYSSLHMEGGGVGGRGRGWRKGEGLEVVGGCYRTPFEV